MYTVDVVTQSGVRPEELPSTSHSAGPLLVWTSMPPGCTHTHPFTPQFYVLT